MLCHTAFSQKIEITGKVIDDKGTPLQGVSVQEKNSRTGTVTGPDGNFRLNTQQGATLLISSVGFGRKEVQVGANSQLSVITLSNVDASLSEVVVTGLGIRREKKALGYAVTTVGSKDLELKPENDVARILNGKVPGVDILNSNGLSGSGTNIIIRGISTISGGSVTPLFIVDGVPFDASTRSQGNFTFGNQSSSRFSDLDPNNIESISVLKGLSAAVIYGDLARNGVVVITTKNGAGNRANQKTEITVSQSVFVNKVANVPDYQNSYGGGFELAPSLAFSNWGAKFTDPPAQFAHPYARASLNVAFPEYKDTKYEYKPYNSVENFFRTGLINNTAINIAGGGNAAVKFNANYAHTTDEGFTPGNKVVKNNFGFGGNAKLVNNFTVSGTLNYATTDYVSPTTSVATGGSSPSNPGVFGNLIYTPRSIDLMGLPYTNPLDGSSVYYRANNGIQHPRWTTENSLTRQKVYRTFGNMQLKYDIIKNLSAAYRLGIDNYNEDDELTVNKGGRVNGNLQYENGMYRTVAATSRIIDHNIVLNYLHDFNSIWNLSVDAGANLRENTYRQDGQKSTGQLVFGLFNHSNFINHEAKSEDGGDINFISETKRVGVFASTTLGFKNFAYLNLGARESWISTLEKANRKIFYPSASISYLPTSHISFLQNNKNINFLKLRLGYATSARFPDPYQTRAALNIVTNAFVTSSGSVINFNQIPNRLPNPNLKPELLKEYEAGVEGKFLSNRLSLDLTLYNRKAEDQILGRDLDPSTGYTVTSINAGNVTNKGIELGLGITPVKTKSFTWQLDGNFTKNESIVSDLPDDVKEIVTAGYTNKGNFAVNGQPLGILKGAVYERDLKSGQLIVGSDGEYITATEIGFLGNPYPDFKLTGISTISFKGLALRAQLDYSKGGKMIASTPSILLARGLAKETDFDRSLPIVLPGVDANGQPNTIQLSPTTAYFDMYLNADELTVYDATLIRLREVSLSYSLPTNLLSNTPFGNISFVLSGQNLWYRAPNFPRSTNFDPETSSTGVGPGRGLELLSGPSSKRYGASVRITF
jgi:TonB-linked SusC/RagA family outer membrane protein